MRPGTSAAPCGRAIVHWRHYDRGSHFSPHDAPEELVGDIREFFRSLR